MSEVSKNSSAKYSTSQQYRDNYDKIFKKYVPIQIKTPENLSGNKQAQNLQEVEEKIRT